MRVATFYGLPGNFEAKRALEKLQRELLDLNPNAARGLEEGLEETFTVHRLPVPDQLRRTLYSTNVIESERQLRKVIGHRQIPLVLSSMANAVSKKSIAKGVAVA